VVEGARLESVCASNRTVSSNLILSAKKKEWSSDHSFFLRGCDLNSRASVYWRDRGFGVVNEAKESTEGIFLSE
jgi:hypothetical protein